MTPGPSVQVRHYVDARFQDHDKRHDVEQRALEAAADAVNRRLESMNEFREALNDASRTYVSRDVLDALLKTRDDRISANSNAAGRGAVLAGIAAGVIGVIGGVLLTSIV
jgi:hypothetical protein